MEKRKGLKEIPYHVLLSVLEKWNGVERWNDELWSACPLCCFCEHEKEKEDDRCDICPLPPTGFCTGHLDDSALHYSSHLDNFVDREDMMKKWKASVDEFCNLILLHLGTQGAE